MLAVLMGCNSYLLCWRAYIAPLDWYGLLSGCPYFTLDRVARSLLNRFEDYCVFTVFLSLLKWLDYMKIRLTPASESRFKFLATLWQRNCELEILLPPRNFKFLLLVPNPCTPWQVKHSITSEWIVTPSADSPTSTWTTSIYLCKISRVPRATNLWTETTVEGCPCNRKISSNGVEKRSEGFGEGSSVWWSASRWVKLF